jgi:DNA-binding transcriptional regulator/RsmH inhibitor MraZ
MLLFTGHKDHRLDPKDRVVIPSSFAAVIEAESQGCLFLVPSSEFPCLEAYPSRVFEEMAAGQTPNRFEGAQQDRRLFFQSAERVELKGPGRITLPKKFLEYFPDGLVRIAGMNTYLELWHPAWWDQMVGAAIQPPPLPGSGAGSS